MVKLKLGGGVVQMSGSLAGNTFARNRGGQYSRARTTPLNPNSTYQQTVRTRVNELSKAWGADLTVAQRAGWIAFADSFPLTDVFGEALTLTGSQFYVRVNSRLQEVGTARIDTAPTDQDVDGLLTLTLDGDIGAGDFDLSFTPTPVPTGHVLVIRMTPGISAGINYVNNRLRFVDFVAAAGTSPEDIETAWTARFGSLPAVGQKVVAFAHLLNLSNGAISVPLRSDVIITTT